MIDFNLTTLPELGHFALILGFCLALAQTILPWVFISKDPNKAALLARSFTTGQCVMLLISFFCLVISFAVNDFSVQYVANNSSRELPLWYRVCATWGAHEGSMLLWVVILSIWTTLVAMFSQTLPEGFVARVIAILGFVSSSLLLFILATSNPFLRLFPSPQNGRDLNALLQDPGFLLHPPTLYMGYVGFSVAFAFAIAALLCGEYRQDFAKWARPWTLMAWCFLTLGITLGSWWAYRVLGWGGWWFWDPVENASFMPWLVGTALLHSLLVTSRQGGFKGWTILLAIFAFSLSLLGTFLVRSGVLTSVHAFATDPTRGIYMLLFLMVTIGFSLILYAWRSPLIKNTNQFNMLSRETFLMFNNVLLVTAMSTVLMGTLYPLIIETLGLEKLSVGAPYFNTVFVPIMICVLFFMGLGPQCNWAQMPLKQLMERTRFVFGVSLTLGIILPWLVTGSWSSGVALGLVLICWVIISNSVVLFKDLAQIKKKLPMFFAHVGVAVTAVGIVLSNAYSLESQLKMQPGDITSVGPYQFQFLSVAQSNGSNFKSLITRFNISKDHKTFATIVPEKRYYLLQQTEMSDADIQTNGLRDLYVALGEQLDTTKQQWVVRIYYKPFVRWIWCGGFLMLGGGLISLLNSRFWRKNNLRIRDEII